MQWWCGWGVLRCGYCTFLWPKCFCYDEGTVPFFRQNINATIRVLYLFWPRTISATMRVLYLFLAKIFMLRWGYCTFFWQKIFLLRWGCCTFFWPKKHLLRWGYCTFFCPKYLCYDESTVPFLGQKIFGLLAGGFFVRQIGLTCRSFTPCHFSFLFFCDGHTLHTVGWPK